MFKVAGDYLKELRKDQEVSAEDEEKIQNSLTKLHGLASFPFTALQLHANITEEDVADVFVRINRKGENLNQADFILTLMSVFWDEGRKQLEAFCREAITPAKSGPSPFNYFIEPKPDQLLRVGVGLAFKRARLQYVYSILRGKNLETGQFSQERREQQFDILKQAQEKVLNLDNWHGFMRCLHHAGFRSSRMISSSYSLLYSYVLYLIGRTEYGIEEFALRRAIGQWFFMSALTGRYSNSPESTLESDLSALREVKGTEQFVRHLQDVCARILTNDFWKIHLPGNLATPSASSPSKYAYDAALTLLEAPGLFSNAKITDLLDPALQANKSALERHHLFPRGYMTSLGVSETREINQIANYAYVEWGDNIKISAQSPADYLPLMEERFTPAELARMYRYHALPEGWTQLGYRDFLEQRRELMAEVIREGYEKLTGSGITEPVVEDLSVGELIASGESDAVEFKSTLRINLHTGKADTRMEQTVLKTIAAFLNTNGGKLVIGVSDDGTPVGIENDNFDSEDRMSQHLVSIGNSRLGPQAMTAAHIRFDDYEDCRVMVVDCKRSANPVYLKDEAKEAFFIRTGNASTELPVSKVQDYIKTRFSR